jgi:nucleotide-binding universal stress UspA family protein
MNPDRSNVEMPNRLVWKRTNRSSTPRRPERGGREVSAETRPEPTPRLSLPRNVLVPLDGTPAAEHALPYALAVARRAGAELTLAHVYSTLQAANDPELLGWHAGEYRVEPGRDYLESLTRRLAESSPVRVRPLLLRGYWPEDALCEWGDWEADLVVMAARRRGWWSRLWHGSVSEGVARRSRTPVLLVPGRDAAPDLAHEPPLGRVLVPLDGTARAERALGPAAALAALAGGGCELLHVVRSRPHAVDWSLAYGGRSAGAPVDHTGAARRCLHGVAGRLRALSVPAGGRVVTDERPTAEAIARYAELSGADVIALASRGGVGWAGLLRGSLALRVARGAPVPVLICRAP